MVFRKLKYGTETEVVRLVRAILDDAIQVLGHLKVVFSDLEVFQECSLFSGRPDMVVVRSSAYHLPLFALEVKKPVPNGSVCEKEKALGQTYDYAESLRAVGHPRPVVVLTTVEESCVCWPLEGEMNRYADTVSIEPRRHRRRDQAGLLFRHHHLS